jgi:hypothetical protein
MFRWDSGSEQCDDTNVSFMHHSPPNYDGGSLDLVVWVPQSLLGRYHVRYFQGTSG